MIFLYTSIIVILFGLLCLQFVYPKIESHTQVIQVGDGNRQMVEELNTFKRQRRVFYWIVAAGVIGLIISIFNLL